jgi:hypothetical protein
MTLVQAVKQTNINRLVILVILVTHQYQIHLFPILMQLHMQQIVQQELLLQQTMTQTYCEQEVEVEILEFQKHSQ